MAIQVIVFDFGGVLLDWNPHYLYQKFFDGDQKGMENFLHEIDFATWNAEQDKGRPFSEAVALLSEQFPQYARLIRAYPEQWEESIGGAIDGTVEILARLKQQGYALYGLSNWSAETYPRVQHKFEFFSWFDGIVLSGEVKLAKPDPKIYQLVLDKAGVPAGDCLFIDDSLKNIEAAKALGFLTVHFQSPEQLETDLANLGIL
ncbi:MAG: HAD-IA family hydrolase [Anaerolineales bacterium]